MNLPQTEYEKWTFLYAALTAFQASGADIWHFGGYPDVVREVADSWVAVADVLHEVESTLTSMRGKVRNVWVGPDADAFVAYLNDRLWKDASDLESMCRQVQGCFIPLIVELNVVNIAAIAALAGVVLADVIVLVAAIATAVSAGGAAPALAVAGIADLIALIGAILVLLVCIAGLDAGLASVAGNLIALTPPATAQLPPPPSAGVNVDMSGLRTMAITLDAQADKLGQVRGRLSDKSILGGALNSWLVTSDVLDAYGAVRVYAEANLADLHDKLKWTANELTKAARTYAAVDS